MDAAAAILTGLGAYVAARLGAEFVRERRARGARAQAGLQGSNEPTTLQPWVDPERCLCTSLCVAACPEDDILRIIDGRAQVVNASACVGHARCVTACPVQAVELIFGSDGRAVEIPRLGQDFETNVPGIYVAGELGGMGLIANAAAQGAAAAAAALASLGSNRSSDGVDVVVVGAGPAGLAAAMHLQQQAARYVLLERQEWGGASRSYPRNNLVLTRPLRFPGYGVVSGRKLRKEELVRILDKVIAETGVTVSERESMNALTRVDGGFELRTSQRTLRTARVILAVGRRGTPRRLQVPGEDAPHVHYALADAAEWTDRDVVVVGGGDSAVQTALALAEAGNRVTLSYRRAAFTRPRSVNRDAIQAAVDDGRVTAEMPSTVREIQPDAVVLERDGQPRTVPADAVFVMTGGSLPTTLLERLGIDVELHFGRRVRFF